MSSPSQKRHLDADSANDVDDKDVNSADSDNNDHESAKGGSSADSSSDESYHTSKTRSTRSAAAGHVERSDAAAAGDAISRPIAALRGMTVSELPDTGTTTLLPTTSTYVRPFDSRQMARLMDYIRQGDVRYVRRLLGKQPLAAASTIAVTPFKLAHMWSPLTSAADFGYDEIVTSLVTEFNADPNRLDGNGWSALHAAVRKSQRPTIRAIINSSPLCDVNIRSRDGWTPLHVGIRKSTAKAVEMLLRYGAEASFPGPCGWTALHLAALVGRRDLVNILVRYGASTGSQTDVTRSTPVHIASQYGYPGAVEQLLTDVLPSDDSSTLHRSVNMDGWTALHMAADRGHLDVVKQLVEHSQKESLNARNKDGCTALYLAVQSGHVAVAQYLVKNAGSDVSITSNGQYNWSVLGVAVDKADKQLLNTIIAGSMATKQTAAAAATTTTTKAATFTCNTDSSADTEPQPARKKDPVCPLHVALFNNNVDSVRRLVAIGTDVNKRHGGLTACQLAATVDAKSSMYVDTLIQMTSASGGNTSKLNLNAVDGANGRTALHYAVARNNFMAVRSLCSAAAAAAAANSAAGDVDATDDDGWTPLHVAAHRGLTDSALVLLKAGCDVNKQTTTGYSALHLAIAGGHDSLVHELVVKWSANVNLTADTEKLQPIHIAAQSMKESAVDLLLNAGADVMSTTAIKQWSCLHLAALSGNTPVVTYLMKTHRSSCDVNMTSSGGWRPLHLACQAGSVDVVTELLKYGADDSLTLDNDGETALYVAAAHGKHHVVDLLLQRATACRNKTSKTGWTELHAAASRGHNETAEVILKHGNDVIDERSSETGLTALHLAASAGHDAIVELLIGKGADCEARCTAGMSALYMAASSGHVATLNVLLEQGRCDVNGLNGRLLRTALHEVADASSARVLVDHGARIDIKDGPGRTPLRLAMHQNRSDVVELLNRLSSTVTDAA